MDILQTPNGPLPRRTPTDTLGAWRHAHLIAGPDRDGMNPPGGPIPPDVQGVPASGRAAVPLPRAAEVVDAPIADELLAEGGATVRELLAEKDAEWQQEREAARPMELDEIAHRASVLTGEDITPEDVAALLSQAVRTIRDTRIDDDDTELPEIDEGNEGKCTHPGPGGLWCQRESYHPGPCVGWTRMQSLVQLWSR